VRDHHKNINNMDDLVVVFEEFANFGRRLTSSSGGASMMDGRGLQKLCRDCSLMSPPRLTSTEVDLIFTKVKPRHEAKIDFIGFVECTRLFAEKLGVPQVQVVEKIIACEGPTLNSSPPSSSSSNTHSRGAAAGSGSRASTSSSTTQQQKQRREYNQEELDSSGEMSEEELWYMVRNPRATSEMDKFYYVNRLTNETSWEKPTATAHSGFASSSRAAAGGSSWPPSRARETPRSPPSGESQERSPHSSSSKQYQSIYDKLTDTSLYTGTHKHRFDEQGHGRGLAGRESIKKGAGYATQGAPNVQSAYKGNTNTGTDEVFHDISDFVQRR
jgi:hypothetical protein